MRSNRVDVTFLIPERRLKITYRLARPATCRHGTTASSTSAPSATAGALYISLPDDQQAVTTLPEIFERHRRRWDRSPSLRPGFGALRRDEEQCWNDLDLVVTIQPNPGNPEQTLVYTSGLMSFRCGITTGDVRLHGGRSTRS